MLLKYIWVTKDIIWPNYLLLTKDMLMSLDLKVFSKNEIYPLKDHLLIILNIQIISIYNNTIRHQDIN